MKGFSNWAGGTRPARRILSGHRRPAPRRAHQRTVDRGGRGLAVPGRLPLLQPVHRQQGDAAGSDPGHPGGDQQRWPGQRADQQARAVRPPLRRHCRRRPAGRPRCWPRRWATCPACCGWWWAWCWPVRCRTSWCCSCPAVATAARWVTWCARRWARYPHHRPVRCVPDHDHHPGGAGDGGGQGAGRKPGGMFTVIATMPSRS